MLTMFWILKTKYSFADIKKQCTAITTQGLFCWVCCFYEKKDQAYPTIRKLVAISQEIMVWPFILPPFYYLLRNKKCVFGPSSFFYRVSEKALLQKCLCLEPCLVVYNLKKSARGHTRTTVPCKVAEKTSLTLRLVSCEKTTVHATVFSRQ